MPRPRAGEYPPAPQQEKHQDPVPQSYSDLLDYTELLQKQGLVDDKGAVRGDKQLTTQEKAQVQQLMEIQQEALDELTFAFAERGITVEEGRDGNLIPPADLADKRIFEAWNFVRDAYVDSQKNYAAEDRVTSLNPKQRTQITTDIPQPQSPPSEKETLVGYQKLPKRSKTYHGNAASFVRAETLPGDKDVFTSASEVPGEAETLPGNDTMNASTAEIPGENKVASKKVSFGPTKEMPSWTLPRAKEQDPDKIAFYEERSELHVGQEVTLKEPTDLLGIGNVTKFEVLGFSEKGEPLVRLPEFNNSTHYLTIGTVEFALGNKIDYTPNVEMKDLDEFTFAGRKLRKGDIIKFPERTIRGLSAYAIDKIRILGIDVEGNLHIENPKNEISITLTENDPAFFLKEIFTNFDSSFREEDEAFFNTKPEDYQDRQGFYDAGKIHIPEDQDVTDYAARAERAQAGADAYFEKLLQEHSGNIAKILKSIQGRFGIKVKMNGSPAFGNKKRYNDLITANPMFEAIVSKLESYNEAHNQEASAFSSFKNLLRRTKQNPELSKARAEVVATQKDAPKVFLDSNKPMVKAAQVVGLAATAAAGPMALADKAITNESPKAQNAVERLQQSEQQLNQLSADFENADKQINDLIEQYKQYSRQRNKLVTESLDAAQAGNSELADTLNAQAAELVAKLSEIRVQLKQHEAVRTQIQEDLYALELTLKAMKQTHDQPIVIDASRGEELSVDQQIRLMELEEEMTVLDAELEALEEQQTDLDATYEAYMQHLEAAINRELDEEQGSVSEESKIIHQKLREIRQQAFDLLAKRDDILKRSRALDTEVANVENMTETDELDTLAQSLMQFENTRTRLNALTLKLNQERSVLRLLGENSAAEDTQWMQNLENEVNQLRQDLLALSEPIQTAYDAAIKAGFSNSKHYELIRAEKVLQDLDNREFLATYKDTPPMVAQEKQPHEPLTPKQEKLVYRDMFEQWGYSYLELFTQSPEELAQSGRPSDLLSMQIGETRTEVYTPDGTDTPITITYKRVNENTYETQVTLADGSPVDAMNAKIDRIRDNSYRITQQSTGEAVSFVRSSKEDHFIAYEPAKQDPEIKRPDSLQYLADNIPPKETPQVAGAKLPNVPEPEILRPDPKPLVITAGKPEIQHDPAEPIINHETPQIDAAIDRFVEYSQEFRLNKGTRDQLARTTLETLTAPEGLMADTPDLQKMLDLAVGETTLFPFGDNVEGQLTRDSDNRYRLDIYPTGKPEQALHGEVGINDNGGIVRFEDGTGVAMELKKGGAEVMTLAELVASKKQKDARRAEIARDNQLFDSLEEKPDIVQFIESFEDEPSLAEREASVDPNIPAPTSKEIQEGLRKADEVIADMRAESIGPDGLMEDGYTDAQKANVKPFPVTIPDKKTESVLAGIQQDIEDSMSKEEKALQAQLKADAAERQQIEASKKQAPEPGRNVAAQQRTEINERFAQNLAEGEKRSQEQAAFVARSVEAITGHLLGKGDTRIMTQQQVDRILAEVQEIEEPSPRDLWNIIRSAQGYDDADRYYPGDQAFLESLESVPSKPNEEKITALKRLLEEWTKRN